VARETIADVAIRIMRERDVRIVMWGDGILSDIGGAVPVKGDQSTHPLAQMQRVLAAMGRDKRFIAGRYRGHDNAGRARTVRGFELKESACEAP
jgi:hypothetical protein